MADTKPIKTLVEVMRETRWWPEDFDSKYGGGRSGQVVVLEQINQNNWVPFRWHVHSEMTDSTSLPIPFKGYNMICGTTTPPTHCRVIIAADEGVGKIDPLTDCCALVPFDPINDTFLTPKGRMDLGKQAIEACLKVTSQWPYPVKTLADLFPEYIRLERGKPVVYNPAEWIINGEDMYSDAVARTYYMMNKRAQVSLVVMISAAKENHPESIDPYHDCCAQFKKPPLATRIQFFFRVKGFKEPSKEEIRDLERGAIAALLDSIGAWPPGRDITKQKPERLEIQELLHAAISKVERANPPSASPLGENLRFLRSLLAKHEVHPVHNDTAYFIELFRTLNDSFDKARSVEDAERALTRFQADAQERLVKLKGQGAAGYR